MAQYPTTKFEREVDRAIAKSNAEYLAQLDAAGPDACPMCFKEGGGHCFVCNGGVPPLAHLADEKAAELHAETERLNNQKETS